MVTKNETIVNIPAPSQEKVDPQSFAKPSLSVDTVNTNAHTSLELEPIGDGGFQEPLGSYQRVSLLSCILLLTVLFFGFSSGALAVTELYDIQWHNIVLGKESFPKMVNRSKGTNTYFEGTKLRSTNVGKLIYIRRNWGKAGVSYGMDRETIVHLIQIAILVVTLTFCILHFGLSCCIVKLRRKFQWISLGYGFVGLAIFFLVLTTLYFAFLHKVTAYLQNAQDPPPDSNNMTIDNFVRLCYACAFAYTSPNKYAARANSYGKYYPFPVDHSVVIENVTYTRNELMELGICPRQDYMLVSVFLLFVTMVFCWRAASYSETLENKIQGPPVWLQRFRIKLHKGMRHWKRRKKLPTHMKMLKEGGADGGGDEPQKQHDPVAEQYQPIINVGPQVELGLPSWDDAYDVLDGGKDHVLLLDVLKETGTSTHKLYASAQAITGLHAGIAGHELHNNSGPGENS